MKRLLLLAAFLLIASPGYAQTTLGTSSSATNPDRSGQAGTGLFSSTTNAVSISSGGTEMMRVNGTGVGIGTTSPNTLLVLDANTSGGLPALTYSGNLLSIVGKDSLATGIDIFGYGSAPTITMHRISGTNGSPTATGASLALITIGGEGYDGSAYTGNAAAILAIADSQFTTSNWATDIVFKTTPTGSTTEATSMELYQNGGLSIGTSYSSTTPPTNGLIVVGNVGIGTSSPAGTLDVEGGAAAASTNGTSINFAAQDAGSGNQNGGNIILTPGTATGTGTAGGVVIGTSSPASNAIVTIAAPSSTSNATVYGLYESGAMSANSTGDIFGGYFTPTYTASSGTLHALWGVDAQPINTNAGTVTLLIGVEGNSQNTGTGTVTTMTGLTAIPQNTNTGTVTTMEALYAQCQNRMSGGTVSTCYGLYLDTPNNSGTITTKYGLYQVDSNSPNYFAGDVGIGTTSPTASLDLSNKTDALALPSGTSAQRPGSPVNGQMRYNTSTSSVEAYANSVWASLGGASSSGSSGSATLPGGIVLQWGYVTGTPSGVQTVSFSTAFPNNCFNVQVTSNNTGINYAAAVGSLSTTGFTLTQVSNISTYWLAIGN